MAEQLLPVAAHLVTLVHGDGGPEDVQEVLAGLDDAQRTALIVVLAGLVDPDQPMGKALGWLDFNEHGQAIVPEWGSRATLRDLVPEPELEGEETYIDPVAVQCYRAGQPVAVSVRERVEALKQGVESGMTYPDFDRMHGLADNSTATFVSRTRKAYEERGEVFPLVVGEGPKAAFTDDQVIEIRHRYAAGGITDLELGLMYGVARKTISNVVSGVSYRKVGGPIRPKRKNRPGEATRQVWAGGKAGFAAPVEYVDLEAAG